MHVDTCKSWSYYSALLGFRVVLGGSKHYILVTSISCGWQERVTPADYHLPWNQNTVSIARLAFSVEYPEFHKPIGLCEPLGSRKALQEWSG